MASWSVIRSATWRFTVVALLGFAPWALAGGWFYRHVDEAGLYVACLIGFLLGAVLVLPGVIGGTAPRRTVLTWFLPAYIAYAVVWCACWFGLGGRTGEWTGALLGGAVFCLWTRWRFASPWWPVVIAIALQCLGYFIGGVLMSALPAYDLPRSSGMWAWGVSYGLGFGTALGVLLATRANADARA